jgi:ATP-dependent Clp endopeptidase proteolytic subunit ClpP
MARIITLSGPVGLDVTAEMVRNELKSANGQDVELHINSPGGFVFAGIEIYNIINDYSGHVEARIIGVAASMMSYIVLAADKITAFENATFMIHNAKSLAAGNHHDLRKTANTLESISNILAQAYALKTGKKLSDIKALMDDETFLFGQEIMDAGFIDEIIERAEKEDDRESAILKARAFVESCINNLKNTESANADLNRAVAYVESMSLLLPEASADTVNEWSGEDYESGTEFDPQAPFPGEHACRIRDPKDFQQKSFRRISRKSNGKTLGIIIGRLIGKTTTTTQAFRYPKEGWSEPEARKHCKDNNGILFEPATKSTADDGGCGGGT